MPLALVTGVSSGIGLACANLFAREAWDVVGTVRDPERRPGGMHDAVRLERLDLELPESVDALADRVLATYGPPDVLINNAGFVVFGAVEDVPLGEIEREYRVNVFSQVQLTKRLMPGMRERGSGTIVMISSIGGRIAYPFYSVYHSSKHAIEAFSESLWYEMRPFGVRVKVVEPGYVETAVWGKFMDEALARTTPPYRRYVDAIAAVTEGVRRRTPPSEAATDILSIATDASDRLRFPIAAYARPLLRARRFFGERAFMRFVSRHWMGAD